jgi:hypothetical protein
MELEVGGVLKYTDIVAWESGAKTAIREIATRTAVSFILITALPWIGIYYWLWNAANTTYISNCRANTVFAMNISATYYKAMR